MTDPSPSRWQCVRTGSEIEAQGRTGSDDVEAYARAGSDDVDEQRRTVSGDVDVEANEHFGLCFALDFPLLCILLPVLVFRSLAK